MNDKHCYLKIGSALTERVGQGEVGGCTPLGDSAWRMLQMDSNTEESPDQCRVGHLSAFLYKRAQKMLLLAWDSISDILGSF